MMIAAERGSITEAAKKTKVTIFSRCRAGVALAKSLQNRDGTKSLRGACQDSFRKIKSVL